MDSEHQAAVEELYERAHALFHDAYRLFAYQERLKNDHSYSDLSVSEYETLRLAVSNLRLAYKKLYKLLP
jgi:hypothetical protein